MMPERPGDGTWAKDTAGLYFRFLFWQKTGGGVRETRPLDGLSRRTNGRTPTAHASPVNKFDELDS
jgi:hypothetical protein